MGKREQYEPHEILTEQMAENLYIQFNTHLLSNYYVLGSLLCLVKLVNFFKVEEGEDILYGSVWQK